MTDVSTAVAAPAAAPTPGGPVAAAPTVPAGEAFTALLAAALGHVPALATTAADGAGADPDAAAPTAADPHDVPADAEPAATLPLTSVAIAAPPAGAGAPTDAAAIAVGGGTGTAGDSAVPPVATGPSGGARPEAPAAATHGAPTDAAPTHAAPTPAAPAGAAGGDAGRVVGPAETTVPPAPDQRTTGGAPTTAGTPADVADGLGLATPAAADAAAEPATAAPVAAGTTTAAAEARTAPASTGVVASRIVGRVMDALDVLENAPPPRRLTVDLPDVDGLRLHVALRGSEVTVTVLAGGAGADTAAWGRELGASLAARGFSLGGFDRGDGHGQPRGHDRPEPDPDPGSPGAGPRPRPTTDEGLRL